MAQPHGYPFLRQRYATTAYMAQNNNLKTNVVIYKSKDDIQGISTSINELAHRRGFWDKHELHKKLMLIVSEAAEAMEADRKGRVCECDIPQLTRMLDMEDDDEFIVSFEHLVKHTFPDELADIIIRTLDLAYQSQHHMGLHINLKHRYNSVKPPAANKKY